MLALEIRNKHISWLEVVSTNMQISYFWMQFVSFKQLSCHQTKNNNKKSIIKIPLKNNNMLVFGLNKFEQFNIMFKWFLLFIVNS